MKQHPIIKALYCNEDGTKITLNGKSVHVTFIERKGKKESGIVSIKGKKISLPRLICECYYGMRPNKGMFPVRADRNSENNHYTNLSWGTRRGLVKIYGEVKEALYKDLAKDSSAKALNEYAKKYDVTIGTIREHKKKHFANNLEVIDVEIIN
jgi:hypothetical protein